MSRTIYYTATTLDGFIADPNDSLDWLLRQPQAGDAMPAEGDSSPAAGENSPGPGEDSPGPGDYDEFIAGVGALVMGSTTYEWVLRHEAGAWPYRLPTWVMTHRQLPRPENSGPDDDLGIRFAKGSAAEVHAAMRDAAGDKDLWVVGGGDLAGQFAEAGLLDEVITSIAPVTLGAGRPLLPRRLDLELLEIGRNGAFVVARHRVVGPLTEDRS
ncbi:dihydrofolate reductase [Brevibacterium sanguinis]|uniref:Dihydrofolate reductase n=2 Tax=Brevibacterium TaxID=1696 RepID=A0A366IHB2_9MICO|nr:MULTISPECIES: dihydrofolate reductase family protein [Brevibacterium]RBP64980.1 dihydrofolate reductase [Brevibacterium sanguinis]RBP71243.1 dihydrofolate reductase [Brevibacterium celere]